MITWKEISMTICDKDNCTETHSNGDTINYFSECANIIEMQHHQQYIVRFHKTLNASKMGRDFAARFKELDK